MSEKEVLIEQKISRDKLEPVLKAIAYRGGFEKLNKTEKLACSYAIIKELSYLERNDLLTENFLTKLLKGGLGAGLANAMPAAIQTIFEPILNSIFRAIGLPQWISNFLVSMFTNNPGKLLRAFRDCKTMAELFAESILEAIVMQLQKNLAEKSGILDKMGPVLDFMRNDILEIIQSSNLEDKIMAKITTPICNVLQKVKNMDFKGIPGATP